MTIIAMFPWEDVDMLVREQAEAELWADVEHDEWLASLFSAEALTVSDPLLTEWWDNGAPSVAGQWTMLDSATVRFDSDREDFVGE